MTKLQVNILNHYKIGVVAPKWSISRIDHHTFVSKKDMKKSSTLVFIAMTVAIVLHSQTVRTITFGNLTDGLAIDNKGNIYCSDWPGSTVYKIDTAETVTIFKNGFSNPNGIAVDDSNNVYICDHTDNEIEKYDEFGTFIRNYIGINSPSGIKKLPNSPNFIFVEYNTSRISILEPGGRRTQVFSGRPINGPAGIALIDTNVYIANFNDRAIYQLIGNSVFLVAQLPSFSGQYNAIGFLTALNGKLYATHVSGNRIYEVDPSTGVFSVFAGSTVGSQDGFITSATFNLPNGIIADTANSRLLISESGSQNLRIIDNVVVSSKEYLQLFQEVTIFPNPVKDELNIKLSTGNTDSIVVKIYTINGKELHTSIASSKNGEIRIRLNNLLFINGNYIVNLSQNQHTISKKIIIQH